MSTETLTNYEVVKRLLGSIEPVGEEHIDVKRIKNLEITIHVVDKLLFDINKVAANANRQEASMSRAGKRAEEFLNSIKDWVNE